MGFRSAAGSLPVIGMADGTQMRSRLIAVVVKVAMSTRSQLDASLVIVAVLSTFRSNVVTRLTCKVHRVGHGAQWCSWIIPPSTFRRHTGASNGTIAVRRSRMPLTPRLVRSDSCYNPS